MEFGQKFVHSCGLTCIYVKDYRGDDTLCFVLFEGDTNATLASKTSLVVMETVK